MRTARIIAVPIALCLATTGVPLAAAQETPAVERPRIGLVLGGGGAKGGAHVGVLQVLDELRVPVDCVAGTSMGALIGAIFASGTPPDQIEQLVTDINWGETVGGIGSRHRMPIEQKLAERPYSNSLEFGIGAGGFRSPSGLIATQNIEDKIRTLVSATRHNESFDDLPLPYRAVAADIIDSEMVVLDRGDLSVAMRASMAIPGVFSPVVTGDDVLVDGGVMRNIPVDVARELCADVIIAVWFPEPDPGALDDLSPVASIYRALSSMIINNERAQLETLTGADVNLPVPVGDIGSGQFQRVPEAIELGRTAAIAARASLQRYALSEAEFLAWRTAIDAPQEASNTLAEIRIAGTDRVNPAYLRSQLDEAVPGATASSGLIAAEAESLYALGDFDRVDYSLTGPASARVLEFRPVEKPWGPDFVQFDIGLASTGGNQIFAILRADHKRTWMNSRGGRWHNAVQLGRQTLVTTDFYQPLDTSQKFFLQPMLAYEQDIEDLYLNGDRLVDYTFHKWYGQLDVGVNLGTHAQARMGLRYGDTRATLRTGIPGLPETGWETDTRTHLQFIYDTRDVVALPTDGMFFNVRYLDSHDWLGGEQEYRIVEGLFAPAFNVRGNSLSLIIGGGTLLSGETPLSEQIELGGIRTFPGLRPGELRGTDYWFAGTSYLWRLTEVQPVFGQSIYGGIRLQAGEVRNDEATIVNETYYGISGSLAGRTPLGPFQLSLAYVFDEAVRFQFSIGRPVAEGSILDTLH